VDNDPGRRQHPRAAVALEVEYRTTGGFLVSYSLNLSKGGLFLETTDPLPPGTPLTVRFQIPGAGKTLELSAKVAWVRSEADEEGPIGMGVMFEDIEDHVGHLIDRIISVFPGLRILYFGLDDPARLSAARRIRSMLHCEMVSVALLHEATDALKRRLDLIVIDMDSVGIDGVALLYQLQEFGGPRPPILVLASNAELRYRAEELGADKVLAALVSPADLRNGVLSVLANPLVG